MEIIVLAWIICSSVIGFVGSEKTIGFWGALFISLLFSPVIGLIVVLVSKTKAEAGLQRKILENQSTIIGESISTKDSPADEIRKYKTLMDEGAISQVEFEAKKKQLLGL